MRSCFIDGEAIVVDETGLSVFELLRYRLRDHAALLCAFDLIELDGNDLRRASTEERKGFLAKLLNRPRLQPALRVRRCDPLQARLRARMRGHRVEAARLALPVWPGRPVAEDQEPGGPGGQLVGDAFLRPPSLQPEAKILSA